jgi:hypothetical protein
MWLAKGWWPATEGAAGVGGAIEFEVVIARLTWARQYGCDISR